MLAQGTNTDLTFPVIEDRLYIATRAFCLWLQTIMATRPIGNFRWSPNIDDTEIVITENEPLTLERTNKRPQIIVYRTQASSAGIGIGQYSRPAFGAEEATVTDIISFQIIIQFIRDRNRKQGWPRGRAGRNRLCAPPDPPATARSPSCAG